MLCNFGATVNNGIVLKDGKSTSTFSFSLSQSLINMAYLIMDRGATLIGKKTYNITRSKLIN
jgi:hypothetical protein